MVSKILSTSILAFALLACGTPQDKDDGVGPETKTAENRVALSVVGNAAITLAPTRTATLKFSANVTETGAPVSNLAVAFKLSAGDLAGSRMNTASGTTASDGTVSVVITAGNKATTFRLAATASDASAASVDVRVDGSAAATPVGRYDIGAEIQPLEFMNPDTQTYATLHNLLYALAAPETLAKDWRSYDKTTMKTVKIDKCGSGQWNAIVCLGLTNKTAARLAIRELLGLASDTAAVAYDAMVDAANALLKVRIGGAFDIKNYDAASGKFDAAFVFDTYGFKWSTSEECRTTGQNNPCCGSYLYDSDNLDLKPFIRACAPGSAVGACSDVGGTLKAQGTSFTLDVGETQLELAYGGIVVTVLERVVFPKTLPASFKRESDGRVSLSTVAAGLCGTAPSVTCVAIASAVGTFISDFTTSLSSSGGDSFSAKFSIAGATLTDVDGDGQPDQIAGSLKVVAATTSNSTSAPAPFTALIARGVDACTSDAACGSGNVCRFGKNPVDACFARNVCAPADGPRVGTQACSLDSECKSGICVDGFSSSTTVLEGQCFQACASNGDCSGGATCKADAIVTVDTGNGQGTSEYTSVGACVL